MRRIRLICWPLAVALLVAPGCGSSEDGTRSPRSATPPTRCPPRVLPEAAEAATNRNARSDRILVPPKSTAVQLCRYLGYGTIRATRPQSQVGKLTAGRSLRQAAARHLAVLFDALPNVPRNATYSCPSDDGSLIYAIFHYANEPGVPLEVSLRGCRFVRNGRARPAVLDLRLERQLARLLRLR